MRCSYVAPPLSLPLSVCVSEYTESNRSLIGARTRTRTQTASGTARDYRLEIPAKYRSNRTKVSIPVMG